MAIKMSGAHTDKSSYTILLEQANKYFVHLKKIQPGDTLYNITLQSCLSYYMRVLDVVKQPNSNEFFKNNTKTIIDMFDIIFKTITVQQLHLSVPTVFLKLLIDPFLEAAQNIAKTNPTFCIKLFEKALEIAKETNDQDNTWFRAKAKRIKDLRLLFSNSDELEFNSTASIENIDNIIRIYCPTRSQQRMQLPQLFGQQEAPQNRAVAVPSNEALYIGARQPKRPVRPVVLPLVAKKTPTNTIDVVHDIYKELVLYEQTFTTNLTYIKRKQLITAILNVFNVALSIYIQSADIDNTIKDYQQLKRIYNMIQQINERDKLEISLQLTDSYMSQINTIINTHSNTNSSFGENIREGQVKPVSILDVVSKQLDTYRLQIHKTQQPPVKQTSKKDLLNEEQIIFAKKYFELNPTVNKLSRHNPVTIQDPITKQTMTMQLPYSVMKSEEGKLYAFYSGKNTYGTKRGFLGEGGYGRVKVAEPLADDDDQKVVVKIQKLEKLTSTHLNIINGEKAIQKLTGDFIGSAKRSIITTDSLTNKDSLTTKDYGFSVLYKAPNLEDYLNKNRNLDIKQKLEIILAVLLDLKTRLHDREIVHGDLNLRNILYNATEGKAYIIDYGFSGLAKKGWINLPFKINPFINSWYAPEQCSLGKATYKSDIYNFGIFINKHLAGTDSNLKTLAINMLKPDIHNRLDTESCITEVRRMLDDLSNQSNPSRVNMLRQLLRRNR